MIIITSLWFLLIIVISYIFFKTTRGICRSAVCLVGKTAIVTGANSGIGYNVVLNLASRGCRVIMADISDMENSKRNVIEYTNNKNIVTKQVDLSSLDSVRAFASDILQTEDRLDILINNAGIGTSREDETKDGLHPVMQVNYFSHFLLTHLLVDLLKKSAPSRVVFTSSFMAFLNQLTPENLNYKNNLRSFMSRAVIYCNSKYAMLLASDMFAEKLQKFNINCNSANPGFTETKMLPNFCTIHKNTLFYVVSQLGQYLYAKNPWEGSQVLVHLAISQKLKNVTGEYFWDCKRFVKPFGAKDKTFCKAIWKASEKYVGLKEEELL